MLLSGSSLSARHALQAPRLTGFAARLCGEAVLMDNPIERESIMANTVVWADIPVTDMDRARKFYAAVLQADIDLMPGMADVALLPGDPMGGEVSGDLVKSANSKPGAGGIAIYLDSKGDPEGMLERAVAAGGQVDMPVSDMGEMVGSIGFFVDTEGNRIGVHAPHKA
jgi:predicted enzyme related to lactoylglutathione lyase